MALNRKRERERAHARERESGERVANTWFLFLAKHTGRRKKKQQQQQEQHGSLTVSLRVPCAQWCQVQRKPIDAISRGLCNYRLKLNSPCNCFIYLHTLFTSLIDNKAKDAEENGFSFSVIPICVDTCRTADSYGCMRVCFGYVSTYKCTMYLCACVPM